LREAFWLGLFSTFHILKIKKKKKKEKKEKANWVTLRWKTSFERTTKKGFIFKVSK